MKIKKFFKKNKNGRIVGSIVGSGVSYGFASGLGIAGAIAGISIAMPAVLIGVSIAGLLGYKFGKDLDDYKYDLDQLANSFDFNVSLHEKNKLPHYRYFEFKSDHISFTIRIDGGIAHGLKPQDYITSEYLSLENEIFRIKKDVYHDIIYNINIEK